MSDNGLRVITGAMRTHPASVTVIEDGLLLLNNLAKDPQHRQGIVDANCLDVLYTVLTAAVGASS